MPRQLAVWPGETLLVLAIVVGVWLLIFGIMEVMLAFRIRSAGRVAGSVAAHAT